MTEIPEGGTTTESTVVFKGTVSDPDGNQVRLEIELRQISEPFIGEPTPETISDFVPSGTEVTITRYGLVNADYRWQYRTKDSNEATSEWVEFKTPENVDFIVLPCLSLGSLSNADLADLVRLHFPDGTVPQTEENIRVTAYAIARAESGGNPTACGDNDQSIGLWQIYMPAHPEYNRDLLFDSDYNAEAAVQISNNGQDWNAWCTWESTACNGAGNEAYEAWLNEARSSLQNQPPIAKPVITSTLEITAKDTYYVGDTITAQFTITNKGTVPITFDVLTVGGRLNEICPDDKCPDFTFRSTTLQPNALYQYTGTLALTQSGDYHFFIAYYIENPTPEEKRLLDENNWNTYVDLGESLTDDDRTENIKVLSATTPTPIPQVKFIQPTIDSGGLYGFGKTKDFHLGKDYNAPTGTSVVAISDGEVLWARTDIKNSRCVDPSTNEEKSWGATVIKHRLRDGTDFYALYGHMTPNVLKNDQVKQGQKVGEIQDCYIKTGKGIEYVPHLHFGIFIGDPFPTTKLGYGTTKRKSGRFVDPVEFLRDEYPYQEGVRQEPPKEIPQPKKPEQASTQPTTPAMEEIEKAVQPVIKTVQDIIDKLRSLFGL